MQVSEVAIKQFYQQHSNSFRVPERRTVRHILVTINEELPSNTREKSYQQIVQATLIIGDSLELFKEVALKISECPTALHDGLIGSVPRGQLYPELDEVLFSMRPGELSAPVETEMGFHLLWCEEILPPEKMGYSEAMPKIKAYLEKG